MNDNYEIIDDFLTPEQADFLEKVFIYSQKPIWSYVPVGSDSYFVHVIYRTPTEHPYELSPLFNPVSIIVDILNNRFDLKCLVRIKANLYTKTDKVVPMTPHQDFEYSTNAATYFINDNDGYTFFSDGSKVASKKGRIVLFNGSDFHSSSACTDKNVRGTIALNWF